MGNTRPRRRGVGSIRLVLGVVAIAATSLALTQQPSPTTVRSRGQALFEEGRFVDAAEAFERVTEIAEVTADDWVNLALARYEAAQGPDGDATILGALDRAVAIDPSRASAHYLRGLVHSRRSRRDQALAAFRRAVELDATDPGARYNLGATLESLGDNDGARAEYQAVIAMGFDVGLQHHVSATYRSAFMLLRAGDRDAAQPLLERYQANQRRLSQAQRAPAALEASRNKRVSVPLRSLAAARPGSAASLAFERQVLAEWSADGGVLPVAFDDGEGVTLVSAGASGLLTDAAGSGSRPIDTLDEGVVAVGDANQDGVPDLAVASPAGLRIWTGRDEPDGPLFAGPPAIELPAVPGVTALDWVDVDHDGDLDLLAVADGLSLFANQGGGEFLEVAEQAGLLDVRARSVTWADFDDDSDVDLYAFGGPDGNALFSNARGGRFEEVGRAVGARAGETGAAATADLDNDGDFDILVAGNGGLTLIANHGDGTFAPARDLGLAGVVDVVPADLNNDGWLDIVATTDDGATLLINAGDGFVPSGALVEGAGARLVGVRDVDGDGALDILLATDTELVVHRQQRPLGRWLQVRLDGIKNNRRGVGAFVEVKAGEQYQRRLVRDGAVHFGLADGEVVDVVRITWPNGIVQNELDVEPDRQLGPITEVERLEGSCPLLYTWDGDRWRFINEVLGVAPLGMPLATGVVHPADFDEYVPVPGNALRSRDGELEIRLTEELRETGYLDAVRLIAVDHLPTTQVIPDERFVAPPHPEFRLFVVDERRAVTARDHEGSDWTAALARADERWAAPFEPVLYEGLASPHAIELTLSEARAADRVRLFLTGWVYWATGSINLQVDQDPRVSFDPVALSVPDGRGGWREAIADIGLPNAKNSTLSVDLTGILDPADPRVRIATTMRLYWDEAYYTASPDHGAVLAPTGDWRGDWNVPRSGPLDLRDETGRRSRAVRAHVLEPDTATIGWRGFSTLERTADGFETFDYGRVRPSSNWDQHRGSYTRYGEVGGLLSWADDRYVIIGTGDEVSIRFRDTLPPVPEGHVRDWLVYLNGWVKDGDPNTIHGDRVEPLPFHAMSSYPYRLDERFPDDPAHRAWRQRYNTRPARRVNEPLTPSRR